MSYTTLFEISQYHFTHYVHSLMPLPISHDSKTLETPSTQVMNEEKHHQIPKSVLISFVDEKLEIKKTFEANQIEVIEIQCQPNESWLEDFSIKSALKHLIAEYPITNIYVCGNYINDMLSTYLFSEDTFKKIKSQPGLFKLFDKYRHDLDLMIDNTEKMKKMEEILINEQCQKLKRYVKKYRQIEVHGLVYDEKNNLFIDLDI